MSGGEWAVVIVCGVLGYMVVSWLLMGGARNAGAIPSPPSSEGDVGPAAGVPGWAAVLGVPPSAGEDQIRTAYRQLMSQYHPDKVASLGQELRDLADRKSKEISTAYAAAMRERGFE
jgi:hypothetical protein